MLVIHHRQLLISQFSENSSKRHRKVDDNEFDISSLEFDPELFHHIWKYDVNQRGAK